MSLPPETTGAERQWFIAARWQELEGETRANLLRALAVGLFYLVELSNQGNVPPVFHTAVTALAGAWLLTAWAVHISLQRRVFPEAMKFLSTGVDLFLMTCVLLLADGPRSPLIVGYFIIIALSALRFNLLLLRFAAVGAMGCFLLVSRQAAWMRPALGVSGNHEFIVILALGLCGVILGQLLRRVRVFADDYARRLAEGR